MTDRAAWVWRLDDAATVLLVIGCADPAEVPAAVRLRCLRAADRLRSVGARPQRSWTPLTTSQLRDALAEVPTALSDVPHDLADTGVVAEVVGTVRGLVDESG